MCVFRWSFLWFPVLNIYPQGTADRTVPYKYALRIQALVPSSELITIEDGGHDLTVSHPQEVVDALLHWFSASNQSKRTWFR